MSKTNSRPEITVVVPARNEMGNIQPLLVEIAAHMPHQSYEILVINDGSTDATILEVQAAHRQNSRIRLLTHATPAGKSGGILTGVQHALSPLIVTVDGDGQNDPRYIPALLKPLLENTRVGLVCGQRTQRGNDGILKKYASKIANKVRGSILNDHTRDTACGLKAFRREVFLALPYFETIHRFLPALFHAEGWEVSHLDVVDRPRLHGTSKYGIWDRLAVGIPDLFGVWWLIARRKRHAALKLREDTPHVPTSSDAGKNLDWHRPYGSADVLWPLSYPMARE